MKTHIAQYNPSATLVGTMTMLTVSNVALTLSAQLGTIPRNAQAYYFDVQDQPVRYTLDGTTPSATNGHRWVAGDTDIWPIEWIMVAKVIREGGTDAKIAFTPLA